MPASDGFDQLSPAEQANWKGVYGESARYFWAAQSGNLTVSGPATEFFNQPQDVQATFYGQYGESAPHFWAAQSGRSPQAGGATGFYNLSPGEQATWYGEHGQGAPQAWQNQAAQAGQAGAGAGIPPVVSNIRQYAKDSAPRTPQTIGAGTEGTPYGFGAIRGEKNLIEINQRDLPHLSNPKVAPGYIPGSGTYNQYRLDSPTNQFGSQYGGLFAEMPLRSGGKEVVNTRFGLGGTGDPTAGGEMQTPRRYITGNATDSGQSMKGDDRWRAEGRGGGVVMGIPGVGGGPPQQQQSGGLSPGIASGGRPLTAVGYADPPGDQYGYGGGVGGGENAFFGSTVTSNWGQTNETAGKDYMATLFLRSDTPTGIGTPAYSAPKAMWDGLAQEIAAGRIYVKNPLAWEMLREQGYTPQSIGGQATGGQNVQPGGAAPGAGAGAGTGAGAGAGTGTGAGTGVNVDTGMAGTLQEGEMTPFGAMKGGLPQGFNLAWHELLTSRNLDERRLTMEEKAQLLDEAYRQATLKQSQQRIDAEIANWESQIAVQREKIAADVATGDKDREQRDRENLRLMEMEKQKLEFQKAEAVGFVDGAPTLAMQEYLGNEQQRAYERMANPAVAFENEIARGATGWNNPGVSPTAAGVPGVTAPGQTMLQWAQAGGYHQPQYQQYAQAIPASGVVPGVAQQPGYQPATQATTMAAGYGQYGTGAPAPQPAATGAYATGQPQNQPTTSVASGPGQGQAQQGAQAMAQEQPFGGSTPASPATAQAAGAGTGNTFGAQQGGGRYRGRGGGEDETASLAASLIPIRVTPGVNAFKGGWATPSTGAYGMGGTTEPFATAPISQAQVQQQNLKQTRKMNPNARGIAESFAKAGGTNKEMFDFYGAKGGIRASTAGAGYNMK